MMNKLTNMYHAVRLLLSIHKALREGTVHRRRSTGEIMTDPAEIAKALFADFSSVVVEPRPATKVEQVR